MCIVRMLQIPPFSITTAGNSQQSLICIAAFALLISCLSVHGQSTIVNSLKLVGQYEDYRNVKRSDFPRDFIFGASTAAVQIEGSTTAEGRGPSVIDRFATASPLLNKSKLDAGIDSYNRYKEDVLALKKLGLEAYRFSISWTRILPNGTLNGGINQEGINHYNSLIDELIKYGIKPLVTLLHFDLPAALEEEYHSFLNRKFIEDFKNYADLCFKKFGDRVKHWVTINEPLVIAEYGYAEGLAAPGRCSDRTKCRFGNDGTEPYIVAHNIILAHATTARLYRHKYQAVQGGQIGWCHVAKYYEPYSNTLSDRVAARRAIDFELGWFMEPILRGDYPVNMRKIVKDRLPVFTSEEKGLIKGSLDFIGLNYYTSVYAKNVPPGLKTTPTSYFADRHVNFTVDRDGVPIGPKSEGSSFIYIYPEGLHKILKFVKKNYSKNITIYITENGVTEKRDDRIPINDALNDHHRIAFIQKHLQQLIKAINHGMNIKGYFYWSLFDDFEWSEGFNARFGIYYIDFNNNLKRIPKKSAEWYSDFIRGDRKRQAS